MFYSIHSCRWLFDLFFSQTLLNSRSCSAVYCNLASKQNLFLFDVVANASIRKLVKWSPEPKWLHRHVSKHLLHLSHRNRSAVASYARSTKMEALVEWTMIWLTLSRRLTFKTLANVAIRFNKINFDVQQNRSRSASTLHENFVHW